MTWLEEQMSTVVPKSAQIPQQQSHDDQVQVPPVSPGETRRTGTRIVQDGIHVALCAIAGVLITVGFALDNSHDADNGTELIAIVTDAPDRFYWSNTLAAFGLVLVAAVGLAVFRLVRGRGRVVATVGGLLLMIGGAGAAAGTFMYGAVVTTMVESGQPATVSAALQDSFEDSLRTGLTFFIGFPGLMLGLLVTAAALFISRATPRWVPGALVAGVVCVFALGETPASSLADVFLTAAFVGIAMSLWKATAADRPS